MQMDIEYLLFFALFFFIYCILLVILSVLNCGYAVVPLLKPCPIHENRSILFFAIFLLLAYLEHFLFGSPQETQGFPY